MESKTLLLDLVQQRKDGRITQEEMVRQLVELRNQVRAHTVTHSLFMRWCARTVKLRVMPASHRILAQAA